MDAAPAARRRPAPVGAAAAAGFDASAGRDAGGAMPVAVTAGLALRPAAASIA
jgi:hypothetical protein